MNETHGPIKLTQTVQKGGCAAKVAAQELRKILSKVTFPPADPSVLVDGAHFDDAAIVRVSPELALVHTLDFFTPIVDTPRLFGRIAAANALSDVYAMGGEPRTALAILAFPLATLDTGVAVDVLQGASDLLAEAGTSLVGGHSIDDDTLKFGLSVTGDVHPEWVWSNSRAREGDVLILTKGLGTGTLTAGLKRGAWDESAISEALESMGTLNRLRDLLTVDEWRAIRAATDITGFGLAGHAMQMARASSVSLEIDFGSLPVLDRVFDSLREGFLTKAHRTNREYTAATCSAVGVPDDRLPVVFDPQTSGGLLLSVDKSKADPLLAKIRSRFSRAARIGRVVARGEKDWVLA